MKGGYMYMVHDFISLHLFLLLGTMYYVYSLFVEL